MKSTKYGDFNMYWDTLCNGVILEVYGLDGELVERLGFSSYDAARMHILKITAGGFNALSHGTQHFV